MHSSINLSIASSVVLLCIPEHCVANASVDLKILITKIWCWIQCRRSHTISTACVFVLFSNFPLLRPVTFKI